MKVFIDGMKTIILRDDIRFMLKSFKYLDERERLVLYHRFGLNQEKCLTLDETSRLLKITRERVRQIQVNALKKLKKEFRNDDPVFKAKKEKEHEIQEKIKEEKEKRQRELMEKKLELKIRQEIKQKIRQYKRPERKPRKDSVFARINTESDRYKFICLFDYTANSIDQLKQLIETEKSLDGRIRDVVKELDPDLNIKTIRWYIQGRYLIVDYQPYGKRKYKRVEIYIPYFLASKENRERLISEIKNLNINIPSITLADLILALKMRC